LKRICNHHYIDVLEAFAATINMQFAPALGENLKQIDAKIAVLMSSD